MNISHELLGKCGKCGRHDWLAGRQAWLAGRHGWLAGRHGWLAGRHGWLAGWHGWLVGWQECWIYNSFNVCIYCFIYSIFPTFKKPMFVTIFFECRGSRGLTLVTLYGAGKKIIFIQRIIQKMGQPHGSNQKMSKVASIEFITSFKLFATKTLLNWFHWLGFKIVPMYMFDIINFWKQC